MLGIMYYTVLLEYFLNTFNTVFFTCRIALDNMILLFITKDPSTHYVHVLRLR